MGRGTVQALLLDLQKLRDMRGILAGPRKPAPGCAVLCHPLQPAPSHASCTTTLHCPLCIAGYRRPTGAARWARRTSRKSWTPSRRWRSGPVPRAHKAPARSRCVLLLLLLLLAHMCLSGGHVCVCWQVCMCVCTSA